MSSDFTDHNPYASPSLSGTPLGDPRRRVHGRVIAPAIALIAVASIGLAISLFNVGWALMQPQRVRVQPVDPQMPDFLKKMQEGAQGPLAAAIQGGFVLLNVLILAGGIQMFRFRTWGMAVAAACLAMIDVGSCCCVLGLPVGIWSLVILLMPEVRQAFTMT